MSTQAELVGCARTGDASVWSRPEAARHAVRDLGDGQREALLLIDGVRCAGCVAAIERALCAEPGIAAVHVNAVSRRGRVVWRAGETTLPRILDVVARAGYRGLPLDAAALDDVRRHEARAALKRLWVAGFGAMQAMMYAAVLYFGGADSLDASTRDLFRWLGFLVATPVVFYSARPFFAGALRSLKARRLNMDVPVALAVAGIYAASLVSALGGGAEVYFESVSMFVFFLLVGRYLEMRARHRASDLTDALAKLTPPYAERRTAGGRLERVGARELAAGDCVHVAEGGVVPADGTLESERCLVDEALLSGESSPVPKRRGDRVVAGSVIVEGPADVRVDRVGADTALAGIAALVARAQASRPRLAQAGERAASRFVFRVLVFTAVTAAAWSFIDAGRAFNAALAVLVVSCPCAFALAVPAAVTRALAVLAQRGVLVVKPDAIEALAAATHVVFDKTGTLTEPRLSLEQVEPRSGVSREEALRLAAALARESRHPAARAIAAACGDADAPLAAAVETVAGLGVRGLVEGREIRLGRKEFVLGAAAQHGAGLEDTRLAGGAGDAVFLADASGIVAAFTVRERLRDDARETIEALERQGLEVLISSGDAASKVEALAARLEVSGWRARQLPADKLEALAALQARGARVIAVGDGVNDAPVLGGADVAVALAEGAELAKASSDVVLAGRLGALPSARLLAQQTLDVLRENQRWALGYNLVAVPLAALGFVPPWLAALGMSFSSFVVVLNALRIGRTPRRAGAAAPMHPANTVGAA